MGLHKQREQRRIVFVKAQLRADGNWKEITICNISSRGLMAKCASPPAKGTYIELRHRSLSIVGRVAWSLGSRFGVRTQDAIDVSALLAKSSLQPRKQVDGHRVKLPNGPATERKLDLVAKAEASQRFARVFDWTVVVLAVMLAGGLLFEAVTASLKAPLQEARHNLGGSAQR